MKYILLSIIILTGLSCYAQSQEAKNIAMFSNLYGAVRWFCPSDEVADMDWEKFAAYGVNKVLDIETERELADTLYALFSPIVPALRINYGKSLAVGIASAADAVDDVTYWQRQGVFLTPGNI